MTATLTIAVAKARFRTASMAMESGSVARFPILSMRIYLVESLKIVHFLCYTYYRRGHESFASVFA